MGGLFSAPQNVQSVEFPSWVARIPSQSGKIVVVTGCTTGTGYVFARTAALKGATVVMLNRESDRQKKLAKELADECPDAEANNRLVHIPCDLMSFDSVRSASAAVKQRFAETGVDVLCNNAGVMALKDEATPDGYDVQMQTNHLSHFLLTCQLFPLLRTAAEQRGDACVVNHSSLARKGAALDAKYLGKNGGNLGGNGASMLFNGARWARYHQTKLANIVFTLGLHDRLQASANPADKKIRSVCAAPGLARTQLQRTTGKDGGMHADACFMKLSQSAEDGTLPLLTCAFGVEQDDKAPAMRIVSGQFVEPASAGGAYGKPVVTGLDATCKEPKARDMLWAESEKACGDFRL